MYFRCIFRVEAAMSILHVGSCEIVEMRDSADAVGYSGPRTASKECSDCGSELCESHRKPVTDATRSSARPAFSSVQRSTSKLHRQTTGKFENERPPSPHPASQPLTVKRLSATDGPFTGPAHRTIVIHLSWNCSVVGVPNSHRIGTLIAYLRLLESLPWSESSYAEELASGLVVVGINCNAGIFCPRVCLHSVADVHHCFKIVSAYGNGAGESENAP